MFREMRRAKQALSAEACEAILATAPRGVLALAGEDGYPYGVPLDFVYHDGALFFHVAREGHKLDAIAACDKACFTVLAEPVPEPDDWWYHVESVIAFGRMSRVDEPQAKRAALVALGSKYFPTAEMLEDEISQGFERVVVLRMDIDHLTGKHVREK